MSKFTTEQLWDMLFPTMAKGDPQLRKLLIESIKKDETNFRKHAEHEIERLSGLEINDVYDKLMRGEKVMVTNDIQAN
jgi:hypothetical protein